MRKLDPIGYDPALDLVLLPGGSCKKAWFIENALTNYFRYGDPDLLLWAINNSIPGLMENDEAKEIFTRLVNGESFRPRGFKTSKNLKIDELREIIFSRVWFHHGRGLVIWIGPDSMAKEKETACGVTGLEVGHDGEYVYQLWRQLGGHDLTGTSKVIARINYELGKAGALSNTQS